jgi:hypothetical protein
VGQDARAAGQDHTAVPEPLDPEWLTHRDRRLEAHPRRPIEEPPEQSCDVATAGGVGGAAETTADGDGFGLGNVHGTLPCGRTDRKRGAINSGTQDHGLA